jgi:zinc protease
LPTSDVILNKYAEAVGSKRAIENFKTQFAKGTYSEHQLPTSPLEIYMSAPNKMFATITTPRGAMLQGYNGTTGWVASGKETRELNGAALMQLKRRADFYSDWKLKEQFARMRVVGKEKINNREAYVVAGRTVDNRIERLYFDAQTGLLLRRVAYTETIIGMIPEATDYEDYREVNGVKIPFIRRSAQLDGFEASVLKYTEVKFNVPVDDAKFNLPATQK